VQRLLALMPVVALLGACASLSTMQTGEVTPKGDFQIGVDVGASLPVTAVYDFLDFQQTQDPNDAVRGFVMGVVYPPLPVVDLWVRYGIARHWDLGLRVSESSTRIDGRFQILDGKVVDLAVGLGLSWYHAGIEQDDLGKNEFKRGEWDIPVILSFNLGDIFIPYVGAKWIGSRYSLNDILDPEKIQGSDDQVFADVSGNAHTIGGLFGFYLGYKWIYAVLEVNVFYAYLSAKGRAEVGAFYTGEPVTLAELDDSFDGLVIYPALGVLITF
jgi:hypothetical protein